LKRPAAKLGDAFFFFSNSSFREPMKNDLRLKNGKASTAIELCLEHRHALIKWTAFIIFQMERHVLDTSAGKQLF
jgi:hypothetical protein